MPLYGHNFHPYSRSQNNIKLILQVINCRQQRGVFFASDCAHFKNPVMSMKILSTAEMSETDVATCIKKHNNNNTSLKFKSYQTEVLEHRVIAS